ncbi:major facilitator superfamily domain-containing protein [Chlamydoabsidia padenii]|nr:major facilitator superfamily domain-containing protein [Chlamydoabsidia padenii]
MVFNIISTSIWLVARSFSLFLLARIVAGLSEGNVQLSIAIISDVTSPESRSRNMAMVGIAFATAFTFGPPLGAWFASIDLSQTWLADVVPGLYPYSMAALIGLVLLLIETMYLITYLPETAFNSPTTSPPQDTKTTSPPSDKGTSIDRLNWIQCVFTFLFSGMEFTLVFLTFDVLDYSHMQQGKLLGFMGILSALIQGGYVRRQKAAGEKRLVVQGMLFGAIGLGCLAMVGSHTTRWWLYGGVGCLAMTSGTVVNCLTSLASMHCQHEKEKGKILGVFRSFGQLGRACGPLSACAIYWLFGPTLCYTTGAITMGCLLLISLVVIPNPHIVKLD